MLSSEDKNSESSKTEVPQWVEHETEEKKRSHLVLKKTDKKEFFVNVVELMLYLQEATWAICCIISAANMSWNIKSNLNKCSVVVNIV